MYLQSTFLKGSELPVGPHLYLFYSVVSGTIKCMDITWAVECNFIINSAFGLTTTYLLGSITLQ